MFDEFGLELLFENLAFFTGLRQAVNGVHHEMKTVQFVQHGHVEGRGDGAFFFVATDVDVGVVGAAVGQL